MNAVGPAAFAAAFAAGAVSFLSPCVLPLIPGYLSVVSGVGFDELGTRPRRVTTATALFVLGFGVVFVGLGAGAAWFGSTLLQSRRSLEVAAGALIVVAGLVQIGAPLPKVLLRERRPEMRAARAATPAAAGAAFAIGWTPCVGPTLAAILALAAGGHPMRGAVLLGVYALGLGIPFLIFGLLFTHMLGVAARLRRHRRAVAVASGSLLVAFGLLVAAGELGRLTTNLARFSGLSL